MRLFLAVAVLMLALVAYTEAQDDSIEDKFARFGERMSEIGQTVAEKAKTTFDNIHNSDVAVNARGWFEERFQQIKDTFQ
ncbi:apolipoprotein C-I [Hippoglossus hippoglossus]|uniref:apolipoprotein C-I n=1 Tax=Hippoglossus hippoglossus TaxID=8267 RepID=UPI00148D8C5A|nr:apolipoprotein C-I [Hippoglossus hippoglossus]